MVDVDALVEKLKNKEDKATLLKGLTEDELKTVVDKYVGDGNGTTQVKACCMQSWKSYI